MEIRSAFAHASDDSLLLASAPNGVTWYHTVPHSGVVCPPTQRGASQGAAQQYTASTQPRYSQFIQTRIQEPGCRARIQSHYAASTEPVQSQYAASTEPGYTARIRRILSQDTQPVQSQYRASTEPVHSQDTQPGYRARIQEAGYTTRIQSQPRYAASTQPAGSQYRASTQPVHKEVQSKYRASTQDTQPVHNQ